MASARWSGISELAVAVGYTRTNEEENVSCSEYRNDSGRLDSGLCSYILVLASSPALQQSDTAHLSAGGVVCLIP